MATVMLMHWPEVTPEQHEEARRVVGWEREYPAGAIFHVAWFGPEGFRVVDVWDSGDDFQRFVDERLMPGLRRVGIEGEPQVELHEAHAYFNPAAG